MSSTDVDYRLTLAIHGAFRGEPDGRRGGITTERAKSFPAYAWSPVNKVRGNRTPRYHRVKLVVRATLDDSTLVGVRYFCSGSSTVATVGDEPPDSDEYAPCPQCHAPRKPRHDPAVIAALDEACDW